MLASCVDRAAMYADVWPSNAQRLVNENRTQFVVHRPLLQSMELGRAAITWSRGWRLSRTKCASKTKSQAAVVVYAFSLCTVDRLYQYGISQLAEPKLGVAINFNI